MGKKKGEGAFCKHCGSSLEEEATYCNRCGYHQRPLTELDRLEGLPKARPQRSPALAVAMSFFIPGLGHIYAGEYIKGLALLVLTVFAALTVIVYVGLIVYPLVWVAGMLGGARAVDRYNFPNKA